MDDAIRRWKRLVNVPKSIFTPSLSGKNRLNNTYLRYLFIAQTIEYLAHKFLFENESYIADEIITEAVSCTSWRLGSRTCIELNTLLHEMSIGLGLLEAKDLGIYESMSLKRSEDGNEYYLSPIQRHAGFAFKLSDRGWTSYQNQEYQILVAQLQSSRIGRYVSYAAVIVAVIATIIAIFK